MELIRKRGAKIRNVYFQDIPKLEKPLDIKELILKNLQKKYRLKNQRELLKEQITESKKKVYNLSMEMNAIDDENDELLFKNGMGN